MVLRQGGNIFYPDLNVFNMYMNNNRYNLSTINDKNEATYYALFISVFILDKAINTFVLDYDTED